MSIFNGYNLQLSGEPIYPKYDRPFQSNTTIMSDKMVPLRKSLKNILKFLIFTGLLLAFVYLYLTDIVQKYRDESTTITTKREPIKEPIWPAITFCMEKPFKPSVLKQKFGTTNRQIFRRNQTDIQFNGSLADIYHQSAYKINRDFELYSSGQTLFLGQNRVRNKVLGHYENILVEEIPTEFLGLCYSLVQKPLKNIFFGIVPRQSIVNSVLDNPKGVTMFVTTENTRKEVILARWDNFYPLMISKKFSEKYMVLAHLKESSVRPNLFDTEQ